MKWLLKNPGWAIFGAIVVLAAIVQARYYFVLPLHEYSDYAVNALQIDQAKHFREIHGNYSRFNFDHPGPAFFYVYALGEWLFYDTLHLAASPAGAHLLAGLILQAGFFALALGLMTRWIRAPLFLPLALAFAAIHFTFATDIFLSIWPPHVLVMPFLAFWVAAVSVAAGRGQDLPWLVLSGSFLVHGHSAQPLFVLVLFFWAYVGLAAGLRRREAASARPWRLFRGPHLLAAAILGLFLLPLVLDLFAGRQSNFSAILRHLRYNENQRKSLSDSALYFLSFFSYLHDQDTRFDASAAAHAAFLREYGWVYAAWLAGLGLALAALCGRIGRLSAQIRRLGWIMLGFWALTAALCLEWGVLQTGPMFDFNGYFYYSVIYALALVFCALLAEAIPWRLPWLAAGLCGLAVAVAGFGLRMSPEVDSTDGRALYRATLAALRADPHRAAPKLLVFAHDDWATAASVGLALERAGARFYVAGSWSFMFQRAHVAPRQLLLDPSPNLSIWRFVHSPAAGEDAALSPGLSIDFHPAGLSPDKGLIDFSKDGNLERYVLCGIVTPDSDSTWTDMTDAALQFRPGPATQDVLLRLEASPFLCGRKLTEQVVEIRFNDVLISRTAVTQPGELSAVIPKELWNRAPVAVLDFHLPNARSPAELGLSGDPRLLSLSITRLTSEPAPRR